MTESSGQNVPSYWTALAHRHWWSPFEKVPPADRLICASNTAQRRNWRGKKKLSARVWQGLCEGGQMCSQFVWQWHICTDYLKIEVDLKRYLRPRVTSEWWAALERSFPGQCGKKNKKKKQTSCLHSKAIRSVRQVETRIRRRSERATAAEEKNNRIDCWQRNNCC